MPDNIYRRYLIEIKTDITLFSAVKQITFVLIVVKPLVNI